MVLGLRSRSFGAFGMDRNQSYLAPNTTCVGFCLALGGRALLLRPALCCMQSWPSVVRHACRPAAGQRPSESKSVITESKDLATSATSRRRTTINQQSVMEPKESTKRGPTTTAANKSDLPASSRKDPRKKQKLNADVGLADVGPEVVAIIASFSDSFYGLSKLREVSKMFNQGVSQCGTYRITTKDIRMGHHVAALRYVCRVAEGKTILLSPGVYKLEGKYDPYNPGAEDDDILECEYNGDFIKGWCDREIVKWKSNKGSLIIEAEGITLRCSDPTKAASINFCVDDDAEDDPNINWAIVGGKVATFTLEGINTKGGLSVNCRGLTAKRCILGGTVDISGDTSLEDCTIRDGKFGGVASCGNLRMKSCLLDDNNVHYITGEGKVGVEVQGGSARFEKTYVLYGSEESAKIGYKKMLYFDPFYDPEKKRWCMQPRNQ